MNLKLLMAAAATKAATGLGIGALIASLSASNLSFAADIKVLDTNLKGGVASPNAAVNSPDDILPQGFTPRSYCSRNRSSRKSVGRYYKVWFSQHWNTH